MWRKLKDWIIKIIYGPDQEPFSCEVCGVSGSWIIRDSLTNGLKIIECSKCHTVYIAYWDIRLWKFKKIGVA